MPDLTLNTLATFCVASLLAVGEVSKEDLATFVFGISTLGERLEYTRKDLVISHVVFHKNKDDRLQLLNNSL